MKKTKLPSLVSVLILTLITVIVWVTFDVYRLFNKPSDPVVPESVSAPLDPSFDQNIIDQVESRTFLNDSDVPTQIEIQNTTDEVTLTETPIPTEVIIPDTVEVPDASASGQQ